MVMNLNKGKVNQNKHEMQLGIANHYANGDRDGNANANGNENGNSHDGDNADDGDNRDPHGNHNARER